MESSEASDGTRSCSSLSENSATHVYTPDEVRKMTQPATHMYCSLKDNDLIKFGKYEIKDHFSGMVLMYISEQMNEFADLKARKEEEEGTGSLDTRTIRYNFGPHFLDLETLELKLEFSLRKEEPIEDLLFIEKHFLGKQELMSFEFKHPQCVPQKTNEWNIVYNFPDLAQKDRDQMTKNPWQVYSDSFFFANGQLIVHNKAVYNYCQP
jgi:hypothetical protein